MRRFITAESEADFTSHAGLGLVGQALERAIDLADDAAAVAPLRSDAMPHRDILASYVALMWLGKSDFEAITGFRDDAFFQAALGLERVPSDGILRQRMDAFADAYRAAIVAASPAFLSNVRAPVTPLANGLVPLDADTIPFDGSGTPKEGASRTSKGHNGFTPMAAYLRQEGWCLESAPREGKQHSQNATPALLERVLPRACALTDRALLDPGRPCIPSGQGRCDGRSRDGRR